MSDFIYHFTDTVRLPWIIETRELQPSNNRIGGFPADFLWATTNENGDRTSSGGNGDARVPYRKGITQLIRITMNSADFRPWRELVGSFPMWTPDHSAALERAAQKAGESNTSVWRARSAPLPLANTVSVHAKSFTYGCWTKVDATPDFCIGIGDRGGQRGFVIGEYAYMATRGVGAQGAASYSDVHRASVSRII